jgi:hypothetical protein
MTSKLGSEFLSLVKQPGVEDVLAEGNVLTINRKLPKTTEIAQFGGIPEAEAELSVKIPRARLCKRAASLRITKMRACSPIADLPHAGRAGGVRQPRGAAVVHHAVETVAFLLEA